MNKYTILVKRMKSFLAKIFNPNQLSQKNLFLILAVYMCVGIGCFYQIVTISGLYFKYPTIVSVETEFFESENELPAFTFCTYLERNIEYLRHSNKTIAQIFEKFNVSKTLFIFTLLSANYEPIKGSPVSDSVSNTLIETINTVYNCLYFQLFTRM